MKSRNTPKRPLVHSKKNKIPNALTKVLNLTCPRNHPHKFSSIASNLDGKLPDLQLPFSSTLTALLLNTICTEIQLKMCQIKLQIILNMKNSHKINQKQTRSYKGVSPKLQNIISIGNTGSASEVNIEETLTLYTYGASNFDSNAGNCGEDCRRRPISKRRGWVV